jgi:hypothetical protein
MAKPEREANIDLIASTIGVAAALALVKKEGGKIRRVPDKPSDWLLIALPEDEHPGAAKAFCGMFRQSIMTIPKAMAWRRAQRDRQIIAAYDGGATVHELVEEHDLTEKQIRIILNRPTPELTPGEQAELTGGVAQRRDRYTIDLFNAGAAS